MPKFWGTQALNRNRYNKLFIRWSSIQGGLTYDDAAYMSLMKNFKDLGYFEDYDSCYFAYRQAHRGVDWPSVPDWEEAIRKFIDYPLQWFYGYGTKPFYAFFWSLGIVMAFFLYWRWLGLGGPQDKTRKGLKEGEEWLDGDLTDILGYHPCQINGIGRFMRRRLMGRERRGIQDRRIPPFSLLLPRRQG